MRRTHFIYTRTQGSAEVGRPGAAGILSAGVIGLVMLAALVLPAVTRPSAALLLTGVAGIFAVGASVSLVRLAITDVRDRVRVRRPATPH